MAAVESGAAEQAVPKTRSPALVAYVRAIGLKGGDVQTLTLFDPDGKTLAENKAPPLDRDKAQWMLFSGIKHPAGGFRPGLYRAIYTVDARRQAGDRAGLRDYLTPVTPSCAARLSAGASARSSRP